MIINFSVSSKVCLFCDQDEAYDDSGYGYSADEHNADQYYQHRDLHNQRRDTDSDSDRGDSHSYDRQGYYDANGYYYYYEQQ